MGPADGPEDVVLHGLGVYRYPGAAPCPEDGQLFSRDGVRPSRLHGILHTRGEIHGLLQLPHQPVKLRGGKGGGGAAAEVDRAHPPPPAAQRGTGGPDLPAQGIQIGLEHVQGPPRVGGDKGAVSTAGGTEGDAHIEGDVPGGQGALRRQGGLGAVQSQPPPGGGDVVEFPQATLRLPHRKAPLQITGGQLDRAHAGQGPPGGLTAQRVGARPVKGVFQNALKHTVLFQLAGFGPRSRGPGIAAVDCAAVCEHRVGGDLPRTHGEAEEQRVLPEKGRRIRILRAFAGEQRQQHLLGGIFVIVTVQIELYGCSARASIR